MRWLVWLVVLLACSSLGSVARAQQPEPVSMPRVLGDTRIDYPAGAHGEARVVLELVIGVEGEVRDVSVVSGEEPFASAAALAAKDWRFEPARRGGRAIAARVRYEALFREPVPASTEGEPEGRGPPPPGGATVPGAKPGQAAAAPAARAEELIEVTVQGERPAPGVVTLTRAEVRELPGAFGDPFRAIDALPGVTPLISGLPFFFVRGAPPGNVGYFLDGVRVPLLYHVGLGPSVVHPGIVERVDLYPGGYPARFGRFAGGIVSGETAPPRPEFHGEASVRLLDAGALVEAPFAAQRGTALVGGRYSYTGLLFSTFSPDAVLEYWDYQGRVSYDLGARDTVSVFSFGAYDFLGEKVDGEVKPVVATEFHRVDLRWDHAASGRTQSRLALTLGLDQTRGDEDGLYVRDRSIGLRSDVRHRASRQVLVRSGADVNVDTYDVVAPSYDPDDPEDRERFLRLFPTRSDLAMGMWGDLVLEPERGVSVTPGLRVDLYASDGAAAVGIDPRLAATLAVTSKIRMIHALGVAQQPPSFVVPIPGFQVAGLRGGLQKSLQSSAGVEADLPAGFVGSFTLFQNAFFDMTDALGAGRGGGRRSGRFETRALGRSVGAEVYIRRPLTHRLGGFFSYTLSQSVRSIERETFPSGFDRTHVLNLAAAYDLGRRWRAGTRFVFYTGFPAEEVGSGSLRSEHPPRVPAFYRVDLRLEKRWRLGKRGYWAFVVEVLNATLSKEVVDVDCDNGTCHEQEIGPVTVPNLGVEAVF